MSTTSMTGNLARNPTESLPAQSRKFYYGWVMLPLAMLALAASAPGQTYGVMIFNEDIRTSLGLSYSQLALAYTLGTIIGCLPITLFGTAMDRFGLRRTMLVMVGLFSLACGLMSLVGNWLMLLLGFTFLRMLGPGALAFLSGNTLSFWFDRKLGTVDGVRSTGTALSMMIAPPFGLLLLHQFGWQNAYLCLGAIIAFGLMPLFWLLFRNSPAEFGRGLDGVEAIPPTSSADGQIEDLLSANDFTLAEAMRTPAFWIFGGGKALYALIQTALFFSLVPILSERGFGAGEAATLTTVFGTTLIFMQLIGGALADHFSPRILLSAGLLFFSSGLALVSYASSGGMIILAGVIFGCGQGTFFGAIQPVWARYYGRAHLGKIRGFLMTLMVGSSALGPLFAGATFDMFGRFSVAMNVFTLAPLPLAVLCLLAPRPQKSTCSRPVEQIASAPA
ncbi:MFS transporter [Rubinisphaera margarita]|uniref:MFS transporter n=1 Tax=Rubinisphaera margarita TaxID=2909586 RepID=UPI001EE8380C|nr:MFS transporter [Rubinisphaera margarita]MCG6158183.1 MFS transporter [Rubinisphaera margarita]